VRDWVVQRKRLCSKREGGGNAHTQPTQAWIPDMGARCGWDVVCLAVDGQACRCSEAAALSFGLVGGHDPFGVKSSLA